MLAAIGRFGAGLVVMVGGMAAAQPLPTDPGIVRGELDNGLRYMVLRHSNPAGHATVWLHMGTGSLNETEQQRGLAHYLEHMAFNGSEHFAPGSLVPFFQSLGMTFGRDQNAFTNLEQTTYQLTLPDTKPATLSKGMEFFADVAGRLSLLPKEIDAERGIIQEERRRGLSGRQRTGLYVTEHLVPGSIYGQRFTIGTEESINGVREQNFKDYYGRWYCASNATLMVVADADPAQIVPVIKEAFGSLSKKPCPAPQDLGVKAYDKSFAIVTSDPEVQSEQIRVVRLEPSRPPTTTVPQFRDDLVARIADFAFNRRIESKTAAGGTSYLSGRVSMRNEPRGIYTAELSGQASPGKWRAALSDLALELQRARAFGFTTHEVEAALKQIMSGATRATEVEATQPAQGVIGRMNGAVTAGEPVMSAGQELELVKQLLPGIKAQEVTARFAKEFDPAAVAFIAVLPSSSSVPSESELLELGTKAFAVKPTPEAEQVHADRLMTELPKPGTVVESDEHAAGKVWSAWLSNNARVHYRFVDSEKSQVTVSIALLGGELLETAENRGITQAATLAWSRPATKHLSSSQIRDLMTGKEVSVRGGGGGGFGGGRGGGRRGGGGGGGGADAITLTVSGSPQDLETGMQLAHLLLTEPKIENAAFEQHQTQTRQFIEESGKTAMSMGTRLFGAALYPDDAVRLRPLTVEQLDRITEPAAQDWLERLIATSPIEVVVVGDLSKERAVELVTRYIGSIPESRLGRVSPALYAQQRRLTRPNGPRMITKAIATATPQAFVASGFYGADEDKVADVRALNMAARILSTRMVKEVREDAQLVYSMGASSRPATTYPGFGLFSATAPTDPAKADALAAKITEMYETLATKGVTAEELEVAKKQMANTLDEQMKQPAYWAGVLSQLTFRGRSIDEALAAPAAYQAMTAEQVKSTFAKYYAKDRAIVVVVKPEAKAEGGKQ